MKYECNRLSIYQDSRFVTIRIIKGGVHDFRGCQIFSLFCRLILQTSVRGDILFRIVATRKTRYVSDNKKGLGCGLNKGKMCVSAKYCYVTHELRLHQNDRCKRFTPV